MYYRGNKVPKALKRFGEIENSGTEINFRCIDCRNCIECKKGPEIEEISINEEVEQQLVSQSVKVDFDKRISTSKLPFLHDPDILLVKFTMAKLKSCPPYLRINK